MYKVETQKAQLILNYLQVQPYRETVKLAEGIVESEQEDNYRLLDKQLVEHIKQYMYVKPLGEVYDLIRMMNAFSE